MTKQLQTLSRKEPAERFFFADDINYEGLPRLSGPSIRQISEGLVMRRYFLPVSETIQAD